jgi:hypothetical protein
MGGIMISSESDKDNDKSFSRFIYQDVRNENSSLWKNMVTVLGLFAIAIGYILGKGDSVISANSEALKYFFASQLIWLFGMIEIILFSNFNSNRSFLLDLEKQFASRIDPEDPKPPYWEYWTRKKKYSIKSGYMIALFSILLWSLLAYIWTAFQFYLKSNLEDSLIILKVFIIIEFVAGLLACTNVWIEHNKITRSSKKVRR